MTEYLAFGKDGKKFYVKSYCKVESGCVYKSHGDDYDTEEDAAFVAEKLAERFGVPVKNESLSEAPGFSIKAVKKYLDNNGTLCPVCGYPTLEGEEIVLGFGKAWQKITCLHCRTKWSDLYTLTGLELIDYED